MKALILLLACLFSLNSMAGSDFSPLQREAVRFMIEDSQGQYSGEDFVGYLRAAHVLTRKELKKYPEVMVHKGYEYVEIAIDDCVYDIAIVVLDHDGVGVSTLYIDFSDRLSE